MNLSLLLKPSLHVSRQIPLRLVPPIEVGDAEHAKLARPHLEPLGGLLRRENPAYLLLRVPSCVNVCHNSSVRRSRR